MAGQRPNADAGLAGPGGPGWPRSARGARGDRGSRGLGGGEEGGVVRRPRRLHLPRPRAPETPSLPPCGCSIGDAARDPSASQSLQRLRRRYFARAYGPSQRGRLRRVRRRRSKRLRIDDTLSQYPHHASGSTHHNQQGGTRSQANAGDSAPDPPPRRFPARPPRRPPRPTRPPAPIRACQHACHQAPARQGCKLAGQSRLREGAPYAQQASIRRRQPTTAAHPHCRQRRVTQRITGRS
jgi:hypothetical protein